MNKLETIHKHSFKNYDELKENKKCGCFFCEKMFNSSEIQDWYDESDGAKTACCPHCGIDSVIGETEECKITTELLRKMKTYFFWIYHTSIVPAVNENDFYKPVEPRCYNKATVKGKEDYEMPIELEIDDSECF